MIDASMNPRQMIERISDIKKISLESAETMAGLYLSSLNPQCKSEVKLQLLDLLGDILFEKKDYRRSLTVYSQALCEHRILNRKMPDKGNRDMEIEDATAANIRYKESLCFSKMNDAQSALKSLDSIPDQFRNEKMNMLCGKFNLAQNMKHRAIAAYKTVVTSNCLLLEAIEALVQLDVELGDILRAIDACIKANPDFGTLTKGWLKDYVSGLIQRRAGDFKRCDDTLSGLLKLFPNNAYFMSCLGCAAVECDRLDRGIQIFKSVRVVDPMYIDRLEMYAVALAAKGDEAELGKLAHEVLAVDSARATGWLVVAILCDFKGELEKAVTFLDKAKRAEPHNPTVHFLWARVMSRAGHHDKAIGFYFKAQSLRRDVAALAGLVDAYLALGKVREALKAARDAVVSFSLSWEAHYSMGLALMKTQDGGEEAVKHFAKALRLHPASVKCAQAYAEGLIELDRKEEAVQCLRKALEMYSSSYFRILLAKVLGSMRRYTEAVDELQRAVSLATTEGIDGSEAVRELEKIESLMNSESEEDGMDNQQEYEYVQEEEQGVEEGIGAAMSGEESGMDSEGMIDMMTPVGAMGSSRIRFHSIDGISAGADDDDDDSPLNASNLSRMSRFRSPSDEPFTLHHPRTPRSFA